MEFLLFDCTRQFFFRDNLFLKTTIFQRQPVFKDHYLFGDNLFLKTTIFQRQPVFKDHYLFRECMVPKNRFHYALLYHIIN